MSWVTVIWSMVAAASLTMAWLHLMVWYKYRTEWANLLFAVTATAAAVFVAAEFRLMRAETPADFATAVRWAHVPYWAGLVALVGLVRLYLKAGRPWLVWSFVSLRSLSLLLNFLTGQNLNYREVTGINHISFLGESIPVAVGVSNPWMVVGQLSSLALILFAADASITVWRRGDRRKALFVGGSVVFFVLGGQVQSMLVFWGVIQMPIVVSLFYLGIIMAMGSELSRDVLRAAQLGRELRESEQQMTLAADAASLGIWVRDLVRNEVWATDKWRSLFGFSKSERLELDNILQRLHPGDRENLRQTLDEATRGNGGYETEYRLVLPDEQIRWIASRGRVEFDSAGKPLLSRDVSIDITRRRLAEVEAQQQRSELAHLSRVTMLGELSGSLAHELNQPLTAILSNAQAAKHFLARDDYDVNELREILTDIIDQDKRAGEVIHRLRMLLRKGEVQHQSLDVNEVVREVLKLIRSDLANHGVAANIELAPVLPTINGDRVQLQQVLLNLVINASDAMVGNAAGDRQMVVSTALVDDRWVRVSVSDGGIGLALEDVEKVFEPFFTTKSHGLGLGLSVCRTIISAHGGKLWADKNAERGATFYFTVPISGTQAYE